MVELLCVLRCRCSIKYPIKWKIDQGLWFRSIGRAFAFIRELERCTRRGGWSTGIHHAATGQKEELIGPRLLSALSQLLLMHVLPTLRSLLVYNKLNAYDGLRIYSTNILSVFELGEGPTDVDKLQGEKSIGSSAAFFSPKGGGEWRPEIYSALEMDRWVTWQRNSIYCREWNCSPFDAFCRE